MVLVGSNLSLPISIAVSYANFGVLCRGFDVVFKNLKWVLLEFVLKVVF